MADIAVQTLSQFTGRNHTYGSIASGDTFTNNGDVILLFKNSNASARTMTIGGQAVTRSDVGTISAADMAETVTIPGSGTNGGECMVGFMPSSRFTAPDTGKTTLTFDNATGLTVAIVRIRSL
jgi:hypothetical protein